MSGAVLEENVTPLKLNEIVQGISGEPEAVQSQGSMSFPFDRLQHLLSSRPLQRPNRSRHAIHTWADVVHDQLDRLPDLPENWDGYGGKAIRPEVLSAAGKLATNLCAQIKDVPPPYVVPASNGCLQFEWHVGEKTLEMELEGPQNVHYLKWDPSKSIEEEDVVGVEDSVFLLSLLDWLRK